jgi:hypothetical protein
VLWPLSYGHPRRRCAAAGLRWGPAEALRRRHPVVAFAPGEGGFAPRRPHLRSSSTPPCHRVVRPECRSPRPRLVARVGRCSSLRSGPGACTYAKAPRMPVLPRWSLFVPLLVPPIPNDAAYGRTSPHELRAHVSRLARGCMPASPEWRIVWRLPCRIVPGSFRPRSRSGLIGENEKAASDVSLRMACAARRARPVRGRFTAERSSGRDSQGAESKRASAGCQPPVCLVRGRAVRCFRSLPRRRTIPHQAAITGGEGDEWRRRRGGSDSRGGS